MRFLAALCVLCSCAGAMAGPLTVRVLVRDADGKAHPAPGARVAVVGCDEVVLAEEALAVAGHAAGADGVLTLPDRPHPGKPLLLVAALALHAVAVERIEAGESAAELHLPPEAVLKVAVRSSDGRPVAGAEILAAPEGQGDTAGFRQPGTVLFRTFTDGQGKCLFYRLNGSIRYRIRVQAPGRPAIVRRDVAITTAPLDLYLERGATLRGTVIAVPGGIPVSGALVTAGDARVRTDSTGAFELEGIPAGLHRIQVHAAGRKYVEDLRLVLRAGETRSGILLRVQGLGRLAGRLLGPDTRPASGAQVYLRYPPLPELSDHLPPGGIVDGGLSDDEGRFELQDLFPAQGVDLIAVHPDFAPAVYYGYSILSGQSFETLILFRSGGDLSGTIVSATGEPVPGARVLALDAREDVAGRLSGAVPLPLTAATATSGDDGAFELRHVLEGVKTLVVTHPEHLPLVLRAVSITNGEARSGLSLALGQGAVFRGRVLTADGEPAPGAVLTLTPPVGLSRTAKADVQGEFHFKGVPEGVYLLTAVHAGHLPLSLPGLRLPAELLELRLARGRGISGRVHLADGPEPAASALVRLLEARPPDPLAPDRVSYAEAMRLRASPPAADFHFENVSPGEYRLEAWTPDGRFGFLDGVMVVAGAATRDLVLRVRGGWGISGVVLSARTGEPLEGALVAVLGAGDTPDPHRAVSDENGVFTIPAVAPGFHSLRVQAKDHSPRVLDSVEVRRGVETMVPDIVLSRGSDLRGVVRGNDGRPVRGLAISLRSSLHPAPFLARTDEWGEFAVLNVAPGSWLLTLEHGTAEESGRREQRLLTVTPGEDLHLDLRFGSGTTLTGRVTRAGLPVSHATIQAFPLNGDVRTSRRLLTAVTDGDGRYLLPGLPEGELLLLVNADSTASPAARFSVEVRPGPEMQRNLSLPLSGIEGTVESLDSGDPVPGAVISLERPVREGSGSFLERLKTHLGQARSLEDGTFTAGGLAAGVYRLVASAPGYGESTVQGVRVFPGGMTPVRILLRPSGTLSGSVVDDAGRPVTGARVTFYRVEDGARVGEVDLRSDSTGRFTADFLPPGRYRASAEAVGYGRGHAPDTDVSAGGSMEVEIRLRAEGRLTVLVYGPGGRALEGARISLRDFWGRSVPFPKASMGLLTPWADASLTAKDGSLTVRGLAPGIYVVRAALAGHEGLPVRVRVVDGEMSRAAVTLLPL